MRRTMAASITNLLFVAACTLISGSALAAVSCGSTISAISDERPPPKGTITANPTQLRSDIELNNETIEVPTTLAVSKTATPYSKTIPTIEVTIEGKTATFTTPTPHPPQALPTLSADDPVFDGTSIDELTDRVYGSGWFSFTETITRNAEYHQYTFEYLSDGHVVEGFLTIPAGTGDYGEKFPVLFLLHGYVDPAKYEIFPYSTRYVMPFVEEGYMVIHPSYRGHPPRPDSSSSNRFRIEYAVDVLNLVAMVRKGSEDLAGPFRRADADNLFLWGHSMGGGIAQRVLTVRPGWVSGAALYASMSGDEKRNYERIRKWGDERTWQIEYAAPQEVIWAVSPIYFLERWETPVTIHHGDADEIVPPEWSVELCEKLQVLEHPVECFEYYNYKHNLHGSAETLFTQRVIAFFERHKK